ncbi:MAG: hypothetical protein KDA41_15300, partial [Planctomycetales bacterium]|nr:hypothetical protein [Planctomycetales bacterium]
MLRGLRWRIRLYTLAHGLAVLTCWLGCMFWLGLLMDYAPVRLGASEMPRGARIAFLTIVGLGGLIIAYRYIVRRT